MGVCQFYLQGRCKFGDNCKNEHPDSNQNRFSALSNAPQSFGSRNRSGGFAGGDRYRPANNDKLPYGLNRDNIKTDLLDGRDGERPHWRLSAYGPGKDAPRQILEGVIEHSPEELRAQAYLAQQSGRFNEYLQQEAEAFRQADQQVNNALNDLDGAIKYVLDGENIHPNRIDQATKGTYAPSTSSQPTDSFSQPASGGFGRPSQPAFGARSQPASAAFGAPSALEAAKPAFGAPTQPSAFGAPPSFSAAAKPTFAKPGGGSAFGAPSALGSGSAFGAPSALGQQRPAFSAPSQPATGAFGAPSTLGQQKPTFAALSQPGTGAFGAPAALGNQKPAFAASTQPASGFGQPSAFGGGQQSNPFGGNATAPSGIGQASQNQPQQPNPFAGGGKAANPNPFAPKDEGTGNAFKPSPSGAPPQQTNGITSSASPFSSAQQPVNGTQSKSDKAPTDDFVGGKQYTSSYTRRTAQGTLQTWKGKPVQWEGVDIGPPRAFVSYTKVVGGQQRHEAERIWHPDGPPEKQSEDALDKPEVYTGNLGAVLKDLYEYVRETGEFKDGIVPEIPPKREWVRWDL